MKFVKPSVEYIPQEDGLDGIYKHIEKCAKVCYKSECNITDDSAKPFVDRLIKSNHNAMLEHSTVYLVKKPDSFKFDNLEGIIALNDTHRRYSWLKVNASTYMTGIVTNFRIIVEHNLQKDIEKYLGSSSLFSSKDRRYTMKFVTDIGVCRELLRHRNFSFANESTRYCNYSKGKFGSELTFITPIWYTGGNGINDKECSMDSEFELNCEEAEKSYLRMISWGAAPQEARQVLPLATKTELVMTGFEDDWECFFDLRLRGTTGKPHPDMQHLAQLAWNEFKDKLNLEL